MVNPEIILETNKLLDEASPDSMSAFSKNSKESQKYFL